MKKSLSTLLSNGLPLLLIISVASSFCANDKNSDKIATKKTLSYTDGLCFDLISPAIKRLMQEDHDNFASIFRHNNALWSSMHKNESVAMKQPNRFLHDTSIPSVMYTRYTRKNNRLFPHKDYTFVFNSALSENPSCTYSTWSNGYCNAISNDTTVGLCKAIKHKVPAPSICRLINEFSKRPSRPHLTTPQISYTSKHHSYCTPFQIGILRFAHNKKSESKSIITALMKAKVPLDSMDPIIYTDHPGLSTHTNNNYLDLLTRKELQSLVQEERDYIKNAYLTLQARSTKEKTQLPSKLLIKIMNYVVGIEFCPDVYKKIVNDDDDCTYQDANSDIDDNNTA